MYDAKKENTNKENTDLDLNLNLRCQCIATSSYFQNKHNCNLMNIKSSCIPIDNIFY